MAYIGKIAAVVTANTSDLSRKLTGAKADVERFARSTYSAISSANTAAGKSFDAIYTPLQKLERAFSAASSRTLDLVDKAQVDKIRSMVSAAEQLAKPLGSASKAFGSLSYDIQGNFINALVSAQKASAAVRDEINRTGSVGEVRFEAVRRKVEATTAAMSRLGEAGRMAGGLATGQELRFQRPSFVAESQRAAALQQQAAALSPDQISGSGVASLVGRQRQAADEAASLLATLERVRLSRTGDAQAAEAAYNAQVAALKTVNGELEREISLIQAAATAQERAAAAETSTLINRAKAQKEFYEESRRLQQVAAEDAAAPLIARARAEKEFYEESARLRRAAAQDSLEYETVGRFVGQTSNVAAGQARQRRNAARDMLGFQNRGPTELPAELDATGGRMVSLRSQIDSLSAATRSRLLPEVRGVGAEFARLAGTIRPSVAEVTRLEQAVSRVEAIVSRASLAGNFRNSFGGPGVEGLNVGLNGRALDAYTAQLRVLQGAIGTVSAEARGPAVQAFNVLRNAIADAMEEGTLEAADTRATLRGLTQDAVNATASVSRIGARDLAARVRRAGDVSRGGFDRAQLAIQQAAFALDDFFSVTGGLDQRIRAAGNNISQLGFIIGGTWGLVAGIVASVGAQASVALVNWLNNGRKAEDQTKALTSALEAQKQAAEALAESYRKVAESVVDAGMSERGKKSSSIARQVGEIRDQQRKAREGRVQAVDLGVARARGDVARFERELGAATTPEDQVKAQLQLQAAKERLKQEERRAVDDAERRSKGDIRSRVVGTLSENYRTEAGILTMGGASQRAEQQVAGLQNLGQDPEELIAALDARINELVGREGFASLIFPLQQLREQLLTQVRQIAADRIAARISREALRIAQAMDKAQSDIAAAFDGVSGASAIEDEINSFAESLAQLQKAAGEAASKGNLEQAAAINEDITAIRAHIDALRDAAAAVKVFGGEMARISQSIANDVASLEQRAEKARREDIEAGGTPESFDRRKRAEKDFRDARKAQQEFEDRRASAIERMEQTSVQRGDGRFKRLREIDAMLAAPANGVGENGTRGGSAEEREAARAERRRLQASIDADAERDPDVQAAQRDRDEMTRRAQRGESADRGAELAMTPAAKAARDYGRQARDITESFTRDIMGKRIVVDEKGRDAALGRLMESGAQAVAPAIMGFREERMNAALQGPSRAALNVADTGTMEGQRELNRLMRGDDSAKDVNLQELKHQSELLQGVIDAIKDEGGGVLEMRG